MENNKSTVSFVAVRACEKTLQSSDTFAAGFCAFIQCISCNCFVFLGRRDSSDRSLNDDGSQGPRLRTG